jgi:LacI family transcriptional regulator
MGRDGGKAKRRPSMVDVARAAGVSQTTVSFVINDRPGAAIPEATRARVWAAVEELGYRRNALARDLRRERTHTIGFVSELITSSPYGGAMIAGAQEAASEHDVMLLLAETGGDPAVARRAVDLMLERQVGALVYGAMYHKEVEPPPAAADVRTLLLDAFDAEGAYPSIVPDDEQGGHDATSLLLGHGHRRIGLVNNIEDIPAARLRLAGYRRALEEAGVEPDPRLIVAGDVGASTGYDLTRELLTLDEPPTAIFSFNDRFALGVYRAISEMGLRIPDDISVVGFDNEDVIAAGVFPGLTTFELPHRAMGRWAVEKLLGSTSAPLGAEQRREPCPLIERSSVAPPPVGR